MGSVRKDTNRGKGRFVLRRAVSATSALDCAPDSTDLGSSALRTGVGKNGQIKTAQVIATIAALIFLNDACIRQTFGFAENCLCPGSYLIANLGLNRIRTRTPGAPPGHCADRLLRLA